MRRPLIIATVLVACLMGAFVPRASGEPTPPPTDAPSTTSPPDEGSTTTSTTSTSTTSTTSVPPASSTTPPSPINALAVGVPASPVDEAPDFSTRAWSDPWDMSNRDDMLLDPFGPAQNLSHAVFAGGQLQFTATGESYVMPLWTGIPKTLLMGRDGALSQNTIDANTYKYLSIRMISGPLANGGIFWTNCGKLANPCSGGMPVSFPGSGDGKYHTYTFKLEKFTPFGAAPWSGAIHGLRIAMNTGGAPRNVKIDWMRLYQPGQTGSLTGASPGSSIYYTGHGASCEQLTGAVNTDLGALPPDMYRFSTSSSCSSFSNPVTIASRPTPIVTSPSEVGGKDYATNVLRNPWDLGSPGDVNRTGNVCNTRYSNPAGAFSGYSCASNGFTNDPQVYMHVGGGGFAIPSSVYHRATVTFTYDGSYSLTSSCHGGTIGRLIWLDTLHPGKIMQTKGWLTYKDRSVFTFDLASGVSKVNEENVGNKYNFALPKGYYVKTFRWDPSEDPCSRGFHLHDVKLAADNQPSASVFKIAWRDPRMMAGDTVSIFALNTSVRGSTWKTIASARPNSRTGTSFAWNTNGLAHGKYRILIRVYRGVPGIGAPLAGDFTATGPVSV